VWFLGCFTASGKIITTHSTTSDIVVNGCSTLEELPTALCLRVIAIACFTPSSTCCYALLMKESTIPIKGKGITHKLSCIHMYRCCSCLLDKMFLWLSCPSVTILFRWTGGGQQVYLCTDFYGWESNKILMSSGHTLVPFTTTSGM